MADKDRVVKKELLKKYGFKKGSSHWSLAKPEKVEIRIGELEEMSLLNLKEILNGITKRAKAS